jgi:geranylgeranylglycerol-phosphate geranylgeranyltransferase
MNRAGARPLLAVVELVRPSKPIAASLFTLLGAYLAAPLVQVLSAPALTAASVVLLVTAFGFVVNDCYDLAVDRVGKPYRPIPSGRVSSRWAAGFAVVLALAALAVSTSLGWGFAMIALGAVALSWGYSYRLKDTLLLGNAAVAVLVTASLVYGALAVGAPGAAVWIAAAISFPYIVAQEALFNLEDEDQDRAAGLRTTATRLGGDGTARVIRAVLALFILGALAPAALGLVSATYGAAALVLLVLPAAFLIYLLRRPLSRIAIARAATLSRLVWAASFVPLGLLK